MSTIQPRLGHSVIYTLSEYDVRDIIQRRLSAGRGTYVGNDPREGARYPGIIVGDHYQPRPPVVERSVAEIQRIVGAEDDGRYGEDTVGRVEIWQMNHAVKRDGKWGPACEDALALEQLNQSTVNLQIFLDGNDTFWATSRTVFNPGKHGEITKAGYEAIDLGAEYPDIIANPEYWVTEPKGHFEYGV